MDWPEIGTRWKRVLHPAPPARESVPDRHPQAHLLVKEVEPREPAGREIRGLFFDHASQMAAPRLHGKPYTTDHEGFWRHWEPA